MYPSSFTISRNVAYPRVRKNFKFHGTNIDEIPDLEVQQLLRIRCSNVILDSLIRELSETTRHYLRKKATTLNRVELTALKN